MYVLSNELGCVLATYGSALRDMAVDQAKLIVQQTGAKVAMHYVIAPRPPIGSSISMSGIVEWF